MKISSTEDFVRELDELATAVIGMDATTFTDPRVIDAATRLSRAVEGSLLDGMVVSGEHTAVTEAGL